LSPSRCKWHTTRTPTPSLPHTGTPPSWRRQPEDGVLGLHRLECLLFGSLIATYLVYKGRSLVGPYPHEILNIPFTSFSTFDLLMSSLAMVLALAAVQRGDMKQGKLCCSSTALLGLIFLGGQFWEFSHFVHEGLGLTTNLFGSTFYVLTGTHGAHVTIGVIWLLTLWIQALRGKLGPQNAADRRNHRVVLALRGRRVDRDLYGRLLIQ